VIIIYTQRTIAEMSLRILIVEEEEVERREGKMMLS
jgi:hypothetical protein